MGWALLHHILEYHNAGPALPHVSALPPSATETAVKARHDVLCTYVGGIQRQFSEKHVFALVIHKQASNPL